MATPPRSFSLIPWLLCLLLGAGWYFAAHPDALPLGGLLKRSGLAATSRQRMLAAWSSVGFDTTAVGQRWRRIGDSVLLAPQPTQLPLSLRAYFGDEPDATAWTFLVPAGTVLPVLVESSLLDGEPLIELYRQVPSGDSTVLELLAELHAGADTLRPAVDADAQLVLRVEATPLAQGNVRVRISTAPALGVFPVEGAGLREVHSRWGAERDGGGRRHEGIDIFRPKGTPLLAAAAGIVRSTKEGGLGGRQVWLQVAGQPLSLYYAHLDEWRVAVGERVAAGDTVGTVGNTGNAHTTPPHLHFGVYTRHGAVDPLPYVGPAEEAPRPLGAELGRSYATRLGRSLGSGSLRLPAKLYVRPLATANAQTSVRLADGSSRLVAVSALHVVREPNEQLWLEQGTLLRTQPAQTSPALDSLAADTVVQVLAKAGAGKGEASYVQAANGRRGWIGGGTD